ncbi:MAG: hypothetical protein L6W00_27190 [Lentisphaeria bacterium]|nr:MAG: hypothetical protein L6W00_27190 [Lentisphaeria bacterium]
MNSRKLLKAALDGCDRADVANAIGISLGSLNNQIAGELPYFPKGKTFNFLDRVYHFIDATSSTTGKQIVLQGLAEEFGYMLIANPAIRVDETPAITQISRILAEFSSVVDEIGRANEDGRIESFEAERIRARWEILKRMIEEFVLACESGSFNR